eukprot:2674076-Prymnesium_polylepis.1
MPRDATSCRFSSSSATCNPFTSASLISSCLHRPLVFASSEMSSSFGTCSKALAAAATEAAEAAGAVERDAAESDRDAAGTGAAEERGAADETGGVADGLSPIFGPSFSSTVCSSLLTVASAAAFILASIAKRTTASGRRHPVPAARGGRRAWQTHTVPWVGRVAYSK